MLQDKIGVPVINVKKTTKYDLQIKLEYFISHSFILFQKSLNSLKRVKSFNLQTKSLNVRALLLMLYTIITKQSRRSTSVLPDTVGIYSLTTNRKQRFRELWYKNASKCSKKPLLLIQYFKFWNPLLFSKATVISWNVSSKLLRARALHVILNVCCVALFRSFHCNNRWDKSWF